MPTNVQLAVWVNGQKTNFHVSVARLFQDPNDAAVVALKQELIELFRAFFGRVNPYALCYWQPWGANSFYCDFSLAANSKLTLSALRTMMYSVINRDAAVGIDKQRYPNTDGLSPQHMATKGQDISPQLYGKTITFVIECV